MQLSVFLNVALLGVKGLALYWSHSYAVLSSLVDTAVDLVNMCVLYAAEHAMARPTPRFPAGKTRLEPLAVMINAVLMCTLSLGVRRHNVEIRWGETRSPKVFSEFVEAERD